jgi:hypothetical protein
LLIFFIGYHPYALAGFDLTIHCFDLFGGRRTTPPGLASRFAFFRNVGRKAKLDTSLDCICEEKMVSIFIFQNTPPITKI